MLMILKDSFIALDTEPTDLSPYADNAVLRINTPDPGKWLEVNQNTQWGHGVRVVAATSGNNSGVSLVGTSTYGSIATEEGTALTAATSPIGRIEYQSDNDIEILIKKEDLSAVNQALSTIYMRVYSGPPTNLTDLSTVTLTKGSDLTLDGVVYQNYSVTAGSGEYTRFTGWLSQYSNTLYFRFFTADTPDTMEGQDASPLDFFDEKTVSEIDPPDTGQSIVTKLSALTGASKLPASSISVDTSAFDENLTLTETDAQKAFDRIDSIKTKTNDDIEKLDLFTLNKSVKSTATFQNVNFGSQFIRGRFDFRLSDNSLTISNIGNYIYAKYTGRNEYLLRYTISTQNLAVINSTSYEDISTMGTDYSNEVLYLIRETNRNRNPDKQILRISNSQVSQFSSISLSHVKTILPADLGVSSVTYSFMPGNLVVYNNKLYFPGTFGNDRVIFVYDLSTNTFLNNERIIVPTSITTSKIIHRASMLISSDVLYLNYYGDDGGGNPVASQIGKFYAINITTKLAVPSLNFNLNYGSGFLDSNKYLYGPYSGIGLQHSPITSGGTLLESGIWAKGRGGLSFFSPIPGQSTLDSVSVNNKIDLPKKTPRRVTALPDTVTKGEQLYVTAPYDKNNGFDITPNNFAEGPFDGFNVGNRGWIRTIGGYGEGELYPDDSEISNLLAVSDTRLYVIRNTLTDLSALDIDGTEYALTRVPQSAGFKIIYTGGWPDADYYTVTGTLPTGPWKNVRLKRTGNTYLPAIVSVPQGLHEGNNGVWARSRYEAQPASPTKDVALAVQEIVPGAKQNKNLTLVVSGNTFTLSNPFPGILRVSFNNASADADLRNRWSVNISTTGFIDENAPEHLEVNSITYPLSYFETDAGQAVYRTNLIATADRITAAGVVNGVNVQFASGVWAGQSGEQKNFRTIDKTALKSIAKSSVSTHSLPQAPTEGMLIKPLENLTVRGGAVLTAAEATGSAAGLYTGYLIDAVYSVGTGDLGNLAPPNANLRGLLSYSTAHVAAAYQNKTVVSVNAGYTPTRVYINGVSYNVTNIASTNDYTLNGVDGSLLKPGKMYYVNIETTGGVRLYPDITLISGREYIWNGLFWVETTSGKTDAQVNALIDARVADWAEANNTDQIPANKLRRSLMTDAAYTALSSKDSTTLYLTY